MAKDIIEQAIVDAKKAKELAIKNATNILVEQLSPKVEKIVSEAIESVTESPDDIDLDEIPSKPEEKEEEKKKVEEAEDEVSIDLDKLKDEAEEEEGSISEDEEDVLGAEKETPEEKELRKQALKKGAGIEEVSIEDEELAMVASRLDDCLMAELACAGSCTTNASYGECSIDHSWLTCND